MTLWPALITGVVGVAGIVGTILAARMTASSQTANLMLSIKEERGRARLADKRQVYANFIASVHVAILVTINDDYSESSPEKAANLILNTPVAKSAIYDRLSELELIGSEEVTSQARALTEFALTSFEAVMEKKGAEKTAAYESAEEQLDQMEKQLYKTMREDLGIEPER